MEAENTAKKSFVEIFMEGAFKGWNMGIRSMLTALVLAYALMYMLKASGAMILLERVFSPVMGLFSLPGVAITALVAALMSKPGGVATLGPDGKVPGEQLPDIGGFYEVEEAVPPASRKANTLYGLILADYTGTGGEG